MKKAQQVGPTKALAERLRISRRHARRLKAKRDHRVGQEDPLSGVDWEQFLRELDQQLEKH